jgi:hypothetical protein
VIAATTWQDVALELVKQIAPIIGAAAILLGVIYKWVRDIKKNQMEALANQKRIEEKADGNHARALEEIKKAGKYEGAQEAKKDASFTSEQILRAVEQVLAVQAKQRGRRKSDPP